MRVIAFGSFDRRMHQRVQVLIEGLRAHGYTVEECNVPLGIGTVERVRMLRRPWLALGFLLRLVGSWWRLWHRARSMEPADTVLVGYLGHLDVLLARRLWPSAHVVLDYLISLEDTARDRRSRNRVLLTILRAIDRTALRSSDTILVDTADHLSLIPEGHRDRAVVALVGAAEKWFEARPDDLSIGDDGPVRVVFFGMYTPLHGAEHIGRAIADLAGEPVRFTMIGHGQDLEVCRQAARANEANVAWIDWVAPRELPAMVADHHLCLGIFGDTPKASHVIPNKVFQGAAAGCGVVTSDTSPQRRTLGDAAAFVQPGEHTGLTDLLRTFVDDPRAVERLRRDAAAVADRSFTPRSVVRPVVEALRPATIDVEER